jgi:hypothetical protein
VLLGILLPVLLFWSSAPYDVDLGIVLLEESGVSFPLIIAHTTTPPRIRIKVPIQKPPFDFTRQIKEFV